MRTIEKQEAPKARNAKQRALIAKLKRDGKLRTGNHDELMKLAGIWKDRTDIDPLAVRKEAWTRK